MAMDFLDSPIRRTEHRGNDDLLSAGLGLAGLAGLPTDFADAARPTPAELRRRAIQMGWKGIADLGPLGGYGRVYGQVPDVPGREFSAFARLPEAVHPHRVLCQIPDHFDTAARCLVVAPASGSRGIYGAMALAGAWGLARGCAVVYTDKGAGTGYFDCTDGTGIALDGTRVEAGSQMLEFEPASADTDAGIAVKHAHSGDHPEADWGRHVLQAVEFGLAMLDQACPDQAPFTRDNTRVIAVGTSNGGTAVLQAAGLDQDGWLDGVVALEPNVQAAEGSRSLYDYASEAAVWMPAALLDERFAEVPFARIQGAVNPLWLQRMESLREHGWTPAAGGSAGVRAAYEHLHDNGWTDTALATAASSVTFDLWRAVAVTYASTYLRAGVGAMPGGYAFQQVQLPGMSAEQARATWWTDGTGIPPHPGIGLLGGFDDSADPTFAGTLALRALWEDSDAQATRLHAAVDELTAGLPREQLPVWVVHGRDDGLIPAAFTSDPYVDWLRRQGREPRYWCVPHAQHFDAFLQVPGFGDRHVPLLPYGYAALDRMYAHVVQGAPLPQSSTPQPRPRGVAALQADMLDLPG